MIALKISIYIIGFILCLYLIIRLVLKEFDEFTRGDLIFSLIASIASWIGVIAVLITYLIGIISTDDKIIFKRKKK